MSSMDFAPPKYVQIVQAVQERIVEGTYPAGTQLPSESGMVREFGAGRSTVVRALEILRMEGWIDREHGRGSFVKGVPTTAVERSHAGASAFDAAEQGGEVKIIETGRTRAPAAIAEALGFPEGSPAIRRQRVIMADGEPSELVTLWFPLDVADGTDVGKDQLIGIGVREHLHAVKRLRPARIAERLSARHATGDEARLLQLGEHAPVLSILARILDGSDNVLAVADIVLPGDLHELEDSYPAS